MPAILAEGRVAGRNGRAARHRLRRGLRGVGRPAAPRSGRSTTRRAGTPPASSAPSPRPQPAPRCAASIAEKATQAIALGASQSAGLVANFGTMTKPFHAGRAAHAGVISARLAAAGFTRRPTRWSIRWASSPPRRPRATSTAPRRRRPGATGTSSRLGLSVKKYPLCYCTHRAIDGALDLLREQKVGADNVKAITVSTSRRNATILRNSRPQTGLEAKFSMQFAMASSIVANRVGLRRAHRRVRAAEGRPGADPEGRGGARRPRGPQADRATRPTTWW